MSASWFQNRYKTIASGAFTDEARKNLQLVLKTAPLHTRIRDMPLILSPKQAAHRTKTQDEVEKAFFDK